MGGVRVIKIIETFKNKIAGLIRDKSNYVDMNSALYLRTVYAFGFYTYSGSLSQWEAFWNDEVEEFFIKSGLYDVNKTLGYEG